MRTPFPAAVVALLAAALSAGAPAAIYKCVEEGNKSVYQDSPCPPGKELRNFDADPAEVSVIPFTVAPESPTPVGPTHATKAALPAQKSSKKDLAAGADAGQRRFVVAGMSEAEVIARIGSPDMTSGDRGRKTLRWSYLPAAGDPKTITTLTLEFGKVTDVERKVVH
jgi:hypothetical protein